MRQLQEAAANRSPGGASALTNKKDEDDVYDIEAAVLTGAGSSFRPLSGSLRGAVFPLNTSLVVGPAAKELRFVHHRLAKNLLLYGGQQSNL